MSRPEHIHRALVPPGRSVAGSRSETRRRDAARWSCSIPRRARRSRAVRSRRADHRAALGTGVVREPCLGRAGMPAAGWRSNRGARSSAMAGRACVWAPRRRVRRRRAGVLRIDRAERDRIGTPEAAALRRTDDEIAIVAARVLRRAGSTGSRSVRPRLPSWPTPCWPTATTPSGKGSSFVRWVDDVVAIFAPTPRSRSAALDALRAALSLGLGARSKTEDRPPAEPPRSDRLGSDESPSPGGPPRCDNRAT